jgi:hypothetical protein
MFDTVRPERPEPAERIEEPPRAVRLHADLEIVFLADAQIVSAAQRLLDTSQG